jgi:hypothetical protein
MPKLRVKLQNGTEDSQRDSVLKFLRSKGVRASVLLPGELDPELKNLLTVDVGADGVKPIVEVLKEMNVVQFVENDATRRLIR